MEGYCYTSDTFTNKAISKLKESLIKSGGNELFWGCNLDKKGNLIDKVEPIFYGSEESVLFDINISTKYDLVLHNHPSGILEPSENDQKIAYQCMRLAIGFAIIDNFLLQCYFIIPPRSIKKREKINEENIGKLLGNPDETLYKVLPDYKIRSSQIDLSRLVLKIINEDKIGFIEAPTGIGKSLAYLIPSLLYSNKNNVRIIISTYTKNLQNQLIKKDIPISLKIAKKELKYEVAYGRQNYLCYLAYFNFKNNINNILFEVIDGEILNQLDIWVEKTSTGLLLELSSNFDKRIIEELRSSSSSCISLKCKFYNRCFFYNSKRKLNGSDIIVTNHHLLLSYELSDDFSDFFPPYNTIVFDEGHNLPDVLESLSTFSFTTFEIQKKLSKFLNPARPNLGLINIIENQINKSKLPDSSHGRKILKNIEELKANILNLFKMLADLQNQDFYQIYSIFNKINLDNFQGKRSKCIINLTELANDRQDILLEIFNFISVPFSFIIDLVNLFNDTLQLTEVIISNEQYKTDEQLNNNKGEIFYYFYSNLKSIIKFFNQINEFYDELYALTENKKANAKYLKVLWIELISNTIHFYFYDESKCLNFSNIIDVKARSTIFISATISCDNSFDYIKEQLFLKDLIDDRVVEKTFEPVFPYEKNSSLFIIEGLNPLDKRNYKNQTFNIISDILQSVKAKTMILTTSFTDINDISEFIKNNNKRLDLYIQNESFYSNSLIEEFKRNKNGLLIANMSFWEGIDLPGKELEILIISKLPFKVPDTPILKAKLVNFFGLSKILIKKNFLI
ncbi:MAG: helicase C-terminal domain-containing protein [Exilispira sp.]